MSGILGAVQNILDGVTPFDLKDVEGFPYQEWTNQQTYYAKLKAWYKGTPLNEKVENTETGETVDKYPIKINPIRNTCEKHAAVLFGLTMDSMRLGTLPIKFVPNVKNKKEREEITEIIGNINNVFEDSNGGAIFLENGIKSQYLGGCVFTARWIADRSKDKGGFVEIANPGADEFIGITKGSNLFEFKEAWIVREISYLTARAYIDDIKKYSKYYYIEHYTEKEYEVMINGIQIKDADGDDIKGPNPFEVVPVIYIPHIRDDGFLGSSIINDTVIGVIKEMNLRWADLGDAVSVDSHTLITGRNITGTVKPQVTSSGVRWLDIGSSNGLDGKDSPEMQAVETKSASDVMLKFGSKLDGIYRRETNHPAVADGEDEGSQRSSLTLNTRMWPLVSHVELERILWSAGLLKLLRIVGKIVQVKKLFEIPKDFFTKYRFSVEWPPMLPKDRESLINELNTRKSSDLGSHRHLLSLLDDILYPDEMVDEIIEEKKAMAEAVAKATPESGPKTPGKKKESLEARSAKSVEKRVEEEPE